MSTDLLRLSTGFDNRHIFSLGLIRPISRVSLAPPQPAKDNMLYHASPIAACMAGSLTTRPSTSALGQSIQGFNNSIKLSNSRE